MKLSGKIALITGGSSGIGAGLAERFAAEGANVIFTYSKNKQGAEDVADRIMASEGTASCMQADFQKEENIAELFDAIQKRYGRLDILINNAGRTFQVPFMQMTEETIIRDLAVNLVSVMLCSKYAAQLMGESGWIVNTASIRGIPEAGRTGIMGYCAAKAGVISFTKNLAAELAPRICVNAVAPGFVKTDYLDKNTPENIKNNWLAHLPMEQMVSQTELEELYLMLVTCRSLTGSVVVVDGGYSILNR